MSKKSIWALFCALAFAALAAADAGTPVLSPVAPPDTSQDAQTATPPAASSLKVSATASTFLPPLPASEAGSRVLSLADALAAAETGDHDFAIAQGNLAAARATHLTNVAKAEPSLSASGSAAAVYGLNDQTLSKSAAAVAGSAASASGVGVGNSNGIDEVLSGGLSLGIGTATATSGTRISLSATQTIPVTPQLSASANGYGAAETVPQSTLMAATISQTVWDGYAGGQTKAVVDQSLLTLRGKELADRQARSAAVVKVKQAYLTVLAAQWGLVLHLSILDHQNALLRQLQATYAIKEASAIDLKTAEINAKSAELDVEGSRHDFSLARQRLAVDIGLPPDADYRVAEITQPKPPASSLDDAIAQGLANRTDIAQYDLAKRQAEISAALARGSGQPSVIASGGIGMGYVPTTATTGESINLGVKVAMPIVDAGAAKAAEDAANATAGVAATQAAQLRENVAADIRDAWWNLQILTERADVAAQNVDLEESLFELTQAQVKYGTATNQDMLTASVNAATAENAWLTAKSNQMLAELTLETAMGL